jgi:cytoskeletal protein CcmA (bactofilin family)
VWRKEDGNPQASPEVSPSSMNATTPGKAGPSLPVSLPVSPKAAACVSQGIKIRGEVTGTEDLFVDGVVDGKITLTNSTLTVGPNAAVKAEISSRDLVVRGRAEGKFTTTARIQIWHTARVHGEIRCGSIAIEDGAELSGKVEAGNATGSVAASEPRGHGKKSEDSKAKDTSTNDTTASGAATAGAD